MEKKNAEMSEAARANRLGRRLELVVIIALTISYATQGAKNSIAMWGLVAIMLSLWVPVILSFIVYKKNPDSTLIRHIIGVGYGAFYLIVCLISEQRLVFAYAFPMLIIVTIFCDYLFSVIVSGCVIVIAVVHAVVFTYQVGFEPANIAAMEIEIAASVLVGVYCIISNKFVIGVNKRHLQKAEDAGKQTEKLLEDVMEVAGSLAEEVQKVSDKMELLSEASTETMQAMTEVQHGNMETAESVQNQLLKTEEIQNQVSQVTSATNNISESVNDSVKAISEGNTNVKQLIENAEESEVAGNKAADKLESLKDYTTQMGSIVELIQNVTSQTNLLSLNASIEAARAGEAGRGFAVVASEISNLAAQTQEATENINSLIENITAEMDNVTKAIEYLVESNKVQNESARVTAVSFEKIAENAKNISNNSEILSSIVGKLDSANREIVENIQTVSAITEEVSAHSTATCEKTEDTEKIVNEVQSVVKEMTVNADRLREL